MDFMEDVFEDLEGRNFKPLLWAGVLLWLIYTGPKTYDIVYHSSNPDFAAFQAWTGVFVLDGGLLLWHLIHDHAAKNSLQQKTAFSMMVVAWVGILITAGGDSMLRQTLFEFAISDASKFWFVQSINIVVLIFLAGFIYFTYQDESTQRRIANIESLSILQKENNRARIRRAKEIKVDVAEAVSRRDIDALGDRLIGNGPTAKTEVSNGKASPK